MTCVSFQQCDNCDEYRPCLARGVLPGTGESWQCHRCRQMPDCDECEAFGPNVTDVDECVNCGEMRHRLDLQETQVSRATRSEPAEYAWVCEECIEKEEGARDHAMDQKMDERRDEGR